MDCGSLRDALPAGLADLLVEAYGADIAADIARGYTGSRAMTFRANTLKTTSGAVANALAQASIDWSPVDFYADAFVVDAADDAKVRSLDIYKNGEIYVQNVSAMLPALVLAPVAGQDVLDMAAAPGGKTSQLAALSQGRANITACEKNPIRADRLRYNLQKQGVTRVNVMQTDARKLDDFFTFDEVLLDSPCSGSGTLQLAYSHNTADDAANDTKSQESSGFSLELFERSQLLQRELLRRALAAVKPGGIVVYSTCSVLPQENEQAIRDALNPKWAPPKSAANNKSHRGKGSSRKSKQPAQAPFAIKAEIVPISDELLQGVPLLPCTLEGAACVKPTSLFEGFFVAALKRLS